MARRQAAQAILDLTPAIKTWPEIAESLPRELRQACGAMACGDGWKQFVADKAGGKKWAIQERPLTSIQIDDGYGIAVTHSEFYEWAIEFGYQRLAEMFSGTKFGAPW